MTSAEDIENWSVAIQYYDSGDIPNALELLNSINKSARIEFNIGYIHLMREEAKEANQHFLEAIRRDPHFAIGHYAVGLSYYNSNRCKEAISSLEQAKKCLRNSKYVDYRQLGLNYQLTCSEILLNIGVAYARQGYVEKARVFLLKALECKINKEYSIINESLDRLQSGYPLQPLELPINAIFRPSKAAVDNVKRRDYLGKAKVLFSASSTDNKAGFSGLQKFKDTRQNLLKELQQPERKKTLKKAKRPPEKPLPSLGKVLDGTLANRPLPRRPLSTAKTLEIANTPTEELRATFRHRQFSDSCVPSSVSSVEDEGDSDYEPVPEIPPRLPMNKGKASTDPRSNMDSSTLRPECPVKPLPRKPVPPRPKSPMVPRDTIGRKSPKPVQVGLQFSFASKVTVSEEASFADLREEITRQCIPSALEICYIDQLGRQRALSEAAWKDMSADEKSKLKIMCFGD